MLKNPLPYPIDLYQKNSTALFSMFVFVLMISMIFGLSIQADDVIDNAKVIMYIMALIFPLVYTGTQFLYFNKKPKITLTSLGITIFRLSIFGNRNISWSDIDRLEMTEYKSGKTTIWQLTITPKKGCGKKINCSIIDMRYETLDMNEQEIFSLVKRIFEGKEPVYKPIKSTNKWQ